MPAIANCPKCRQTVTIPDGFAPRAEVRCPLCAVVYPLSEAMAELPPALIPVDTAAITGPAADAEAAPSSGLISEPFHVPDSPRAEAQGAVDQRAVLDVWKKVDGAPRIDTGTGAGGSAAIDTGQRPVDADTFAGFDLKEPEEKYEPVDGSPTKSRRRRKKKEKSTVRFLTEVIVGGFLGLGVGYYLLCWFGGSRFDLPKLPLPLLPHTMHWVAGSEQAPPTTKPETTTETEAGPKSGPDP